MIVADNTKVGPPARAIKTPAVPASKATALPSRARVEDEMPTSKKPKALTMQQSLGNLTLDDDKAKSKSSNKGKAKAVSKSPELTGILLLLLFSCNEF